MNTVCTINQCTGCSLCVEVCPKNVVSLAKNLDSYNAIKGDGCISCKLCEKMCPQNSPVKFKEQIQWYQGWALSDETRSRAASGGVATELARLTVNNGGAVVSCTFKEGDFLFQLAENESELRKFSGSKYIKSNPAGIYKIVKDKIKEKVVLFIGLPCQVAALTSYLRHVDTNNLITVDLICHGTPSIEYLRLYLAGYKVDLSTLDDIKFRVNDVYSLKASGYKNLHPGIRDLYMMSFLDSVCYTENCYNCQYATLNRVSDITLGDSWGSELPNEEWKKGISLILCQTSKGKDLVETAALHLDDVDISKAIDHNHQLRTPSVPKGDRNKFMTVLKSKRNIKSAYIKVFPKQFIKRIVKIIFYSGGGVKCDPFAIYYKQK